MAHDDFKTLFMLVLCFLVSIMLAIVYTAPNPITNFVVNALGR